ncbi:MAG: hypothetical protein K9N23_18290 [Akkermansiaceae bacterium]|nr:hypothetical protein [Akkermansiaceae bacterium]MCF7733645.1 hypothetical protein [Akkermansiaceae bacterium]
MAVLRHDAHLADNPQTSLVLTEIIHSLEAAGHDVHFCQKSQIELKHDVRHMPRQLETTPADAWVVEAGSHPLLEWCSPQPTPCLALYGSTDKLPPACTGPDGEPAYRAATRHLLALGRRRMVLIVSETRRKPTQGPSVRAFLEELTAHGVQTSSYHLPEQVSLVSADCDALLDWCHPDIAHMRWNNAPIVRRVVRWVDAVRKGKPDRRAICFPMEFVPGGSVGPVHKA